MLISPIEGADILFADGARTILNDDQPAVFLPGWRAVLAYGGLPDATIVTFVSDAGNEGLWFLDDAMRRVGGSADEVPLPMKADLMDGLCRLLDGMWRELVLSDRPRPPTEAEQAFLALPDSARRHLLEFYLGGFGAPTAYRRFAEPGSGSPATPVLDCGARRIPLRLHGLHVLFDPGLLQREQRRLVQDGFMQLPSPVDGRPLRCEKAFALDAELTAYRMHDERWGLTSYLLAGEIFFRTMAVYIPEANVVLSAEPAVFEAQRPQLATAFHRHIVQHGRVLFDYLVADGTTALHFWRGRNALHLGHLLWNDLSGIAGVVQANPDGPMPAFLVPEAGSAPEMYGPLDVIFPELTGKVLRREEPFVALVGSLYEMNVCVFRSSGMLVSAGLRDRILATVPVRRAQVPVILFGLRTENRTLDALPEFCRGLVAHLAGSVGRAVLVVDGHNQRGDGGGMIWSHGELQAPISPIAVEEQMVELMRAAAHGTGIEIVSTIGRPLEESLGWCRAAAFFVAFWGAGLAKYRWICNSPGVVLTNRWNLGNLNDLAIYSDPRCMDDPSEMVFVPAGAVEDLPDSPLLIRHGTDFNPSLCNFEVEATAVWTAIDAMARATLAPAAVATPAGRADAKPARRGATQPVKAGRRKMPVV